MRFVNYIQESTKKEKSKQAADQFVVKAGKETILSSTNCFCASQEK